ncbi:hypothetical protein ACLOJK_018542 [Asimina triloba]
MANNQWRDFLLEVYCKADVEAFSEKAYICKEGEKVSVTILGGISHQIFSELFTEGFISFISYDEILYNIIESCRVPHGQKYLINFIKTQGQQHSIKVVYAPPLYYTPKWKTIEEFRSSKPTRYNNIHVLLEMRDDISADYTTSVKMPQPSYTVARAIRLQTVKQAAEDYEFWSFWKDEEGVLIKILDELVKSPVTKFLEQEDILLQMQVIPPHLDAYLTNEESQEEDDKGDESPKSIQPPPFNDTLNNSVMDGDIK